MRIAALFVALALAAAARAEGFFAHLFEPKTLAVDEVIGMEVASADGKVLGRISEVLYEATSGEVRFIALEGDGARYAIVDLVAAEAPGKVLVEPPLGFASAGTTSLVAVAPALSGARGKALQLHLRSGRVRPAP